MAMSIDETRRAVHEAFEEVLSWADNSERCTFHTFESRLWTLMLALGRSLVSLFLAQQAARERPTTYLHAGRAWCLEGGRTTKLGTRFGNVRFGRPVGRDPSMPRAAADLPVDRELGLCGGFSVGVVLAMARLCAQMAFANARENFEQVHEWTPAPRSVMRMVDAVGEQARPFLEQAAAPPDDGEVLVIQVDGKGAPMISDVEHERRRKPKRRRGEGQTRRHRRRARRRSNPKPRRTKGKKSKNAKVAVVGVIYTLRRCEDGSIEGPINKRLYATFDSHEALFIWLRREADKRGYGNKRTVFLADGCEHIWRRQQRYFGKAEVCEDWYHIVEHLWKAGECRYQEGSAELREWVAEQSERLRRSATDEIIATLREELAAVPRSGPGTKGKRERLTQVLNYFVNHQGRMNYAALREDDLDIGTGAAEGAVRNLIGMRLDGPGMRWSRDRSEMVLHLRCILLNGQWSEFIDYVAGRQGFTLASRPIPTRTHTAKAKAKKAA